MSLIIYHTPPEREGLVTKVKRKYSKLRKEGLERKIRKLDDRREIQKEEMRKANCNALAAQITLDKLSEKKHLSEEEYKELRQANSRLSRATKKYNCAENVVKEIEGQKRKCQRSLEEFI